MIEIKNVLFRDADDLKRVHCAQHIDSVFFALFADEDGEFVIRINGSEKNLVGIFSSLEKAQKFYDDFIKLLPDSCEKMSSIDLLDYE